VAKTLSFSDESSQSVKHGDTTTAFDLVCGDDNVPTDLSDLTGITIKIGSDLGKVSDKEIDLTTLDDPETGVVKLKFDTDLMTNLTVGKYQLEVWVTDSNGTSIYPSDGTLQFQINSSLE